MRGIIFDLDGTMVDNMMVHHRAWQRMLSSIGLHLDLDEVKEKIHGVNDEILVRLFGDRFTQDERAKLAAQKESEYREIFKSELKLIDGLPEFLDFARGLNIPLAIGSAAPPENVDFVLNNLKLRDYFKVALHAGSVTKGKPDPEVYQKAAAAMGLPADQCVIFEDSPTGVEAARRCGSSAIVVTTTHHENEFVTFPNVIEFIGDYNSAHLRDLTSTLYQG